MVAPWCNVCMPRVRQYSRRSISHLFNKNQPASTADLICRFKEKHFSVTGLWQGVILLMLGDVFKARRGTAYWSGLNMFYSDGNRGRKQSPGSSGHVLFANRSSEGTNDEGEDAGKWFVTVLTTLTFLRCLQDWFTFWGVASRRNSRNVALRLYSSHCCSSCW